MLTWLALFSLFFLSFFWRCWPSATFDACSLSPAQSSLNNISSISCGARSRRCLPSPTNSNRTKALVYTLRDTCMFWCSCLTDLQCSVCFHPMRVEKRSSHHSASQKSQLNQRRGGRRPAGRPASSGVRPWWRLCCTAPGCRRGSGPGRARPRSPAGRSRCRPWSRRRPRGGGAAGGLA